MVEAVITEVQRKRGDLYSRIEVTGASYKTYDADVNVFVEYVVSGNSNLPVLRINDLTINSETEAQARAESEAGKLGDGTKPVFTVMTYADQLDLSLLHPGARVAVVWHGKVYWNIPIHMVSMSKHHGETAEVTLELGWTGTSEVDQDINNMNELFKRVRLLEQNKASSVKNVTIGGGTVTSHTHAHNTLSSLQGGTTDEYYHLTAAEQGHLSGQDQALQTDDAVTFASLTLGEGETADNILDEDDLVSDSDTALATQQSIKAYVDGNLVDTLPELTDVTITAAATDDFLVYDTDAWVDKTVAQVKAILAIVLDELSDVVLTDVADGDFLYYDTDTWVNKTTAEVQTELGIGAGPDEIPIPLIQMGYANGGLYASYKGHCIYYLPAATASCSFNFGGQIPSTFTDTTPQLVIVFMMNNTSGNWAWRAYLSIKAVGSTDYTWNVLNASVQSFTHSGADGKTAEWTYDLTGVSPGDIVSIQVAGPGNTSNANFLGMVSVFLRKTS